MIGTLAGALGLGCCVAPAAAALVGMSSATAAVDLGNRLYGDWGWAFKGAALVFAGSAIWLQRRKAVRCPVDERPNVARTTVWTVGTGVVTYGALYAGTKALERFA